MSILYCHTKNNHPENTTCRSFGIDEQRNASNWCFRIQNSSVSWAQNRSQMRLFFFLEQKSSWIAHTSRRVVIILFYWINALYKIYQAFEYKGNVSNGGGKGFGEKIGKSDVKSAHWVYNCIHRSSSYFYGILIFYFIGYKTRINYILHFNNKK